MSSKRADTLNRLQKVLAKHYKPVRPVERPVLEQLLYATCLEDSRTDVADECFARLQESFFDWNEVRVTTVHELSELMRGTHDPRLVATHVKQVLHSVFEAIYDFNLEVLKKQNLGAAVKQLQELNGTTPFSISYVVQTCLGGHSIPLSPRSLEIMHILGVINEKERNHGTVPGLERAVPKTKGVEFGSMLQQFAADYAATPFGTQVRATIVEVEPTAKERLPKRGGRKAASSTEKEGKSTKSEASDGKKKSVKSKPAKKAAPKKSSGAKAASRKKTTARASKKKIPAKKKATSSKAKPKKKTKTSITKKATRGAKKSASKQLARRKPR